jgi:phosphatidylglycerol---prolipoprotein diacylglyceryl transferase
MPPQFHVHTPDPFLFQFTETFGIRYYGLAYVLGFLSAIGLLWLYWRRGRSPFNPAAQGDLIFALMLGVFLGGRLGFFLFYSPGTFIHDPIDLIRIWKGGMASHGGFIGVFLAVWWIAHRHKISIFTTGDIAVTLAPAGLMFGRLANYINGELWGRVTDVPWAVIFTSSAPPGTPPILIDPRHPSQLYEAALEGLFLLAYTQWRLWRTPVLAQAPGRLSGELLLGYALARVFCEFFREHDEGIPPILGMNRGAWLSLGLAAAGLYLIVTARARGRAAAARAYAATTTPPPAKKD